MRVLPFVFLMWCFGCVDTSAPSLEVENPLDSAPDMPIADVAIEDLLVADMAAVADATLDAAVQADAAMEPPGLVCQQSPAWFPQTCPARADLLPFGALGRDSAIEARFGAECVVPCGCAVGAVSPSSAVPDGVQAWDEVGRCICRALAEGRPAFGRLSIADENGPCVTDLMVSADPETGASGVFWKGCELLYMDDRGPRVDQSELRPYDCTEEGLLRPAYNIVRQTISIHLDEL